ncbi:SURF1 family protein [uncultured Georgenia sp.]|uniref:SURF1 family cytochrome oxidase biogenesis protein n=1 Tax=uncultured Georgenia sp. TaxID=378209 RepID=UPI0026362D2B|nr:SURF1 family protein [uncultured Georgenia sp.]HLV05804.1 SURF1 family protein [Actinomycetaceae bacterium]
MSRYRFLRSGRWVGLAVIAVVVAVTCVLLGLWQWNRHADRAAANDLVDANYDAAPAPLAAVVDDAVPADRVWRSVVVSGRYTGEQVLVRNRPVAGTAAARVLAVLETEDDGRLVVVDRGWLSLEDGDPVPPDYPDGAVEVVGRLRQAEAPDERTAPAGQVYAIDPAAVAAAAGVDGVEAAELLAGYLLATTENAAPVEGLTAFPRPETTPGSHLSYAFQWWVFACGALVGYVVLARREARELSGYPAERPRLRPRRRSDAEEEDALIDAQLRDG